MYVGSKQLESSSCGNVSIFLQGEASARLIWEIYFLKQLSVGATKL